MIKHVMLLKIAENEETPDNLDQIRAELLIAANDITGLISAEVGYNFSSSDYDIVFSAEFKNPTSLKHFLSSPKYVKINSFIDRIAINSASVDYMTEPDNKITKLAESTEKKNINTVTNQSDIKKNNYGKENATESVAAKSGSAKPVSVKPVAAKPVAAKPAAAKPVSVKPDSVKPVEIKPVEIKPAEVKPAEVKPAEVKPAEVKPAEVKHSQHEAPITQASAPVAKKESEKITYTPIDDDIISDSGVISMDSVFASDINPVSKPNARPNSKKIVDDNIVTKRIEPKGKQIGEDEYAMADAWRCPSCNKINGAFVGICGCGAYRPEFYVPLTLEEVLEARATGNYNEGNSNLKVYKNNVIAPSVDDLVNTFKPVVTRTVNAIKRSANDNYEDPNAKKDDHVSVAEKAAANLYMEKKVDTIRIEPKGKQIKDGESSMDGAWKCPVCGKINGSFVGICGCGADIPDEYVPVSAQELEANNISVKPEPKEVLPEIEKSAMDNAWICPKCGKLNASYIGKCGCGNFKDSN